MKIPSGDLAPARKRRRSGLGSRQAARHRAGSQGHGRSPRRRRGPVLLAALLVAAVVVGGVLLALRRDRPATPGELTQARAVGTGAAPGGAPATPAKPAATAPPSCPAGAAPAYPPPDQVRFRLLNGTPRNGLGMSVGDELARRGFSVVGTGNAPQPLDGPSQVAFGPGGREGASLLALHVIGATLVPVPAAPPGAIDLVLGTEFQRLRTPAEVTEFAARLRRAAPGC